jgi:hypothetical protein
VLVVGSGWLDAPVQFFSSSSYSEPAPPPRPMWPYALMHEMVEVRGAEGRGSSAIERWMVVQRAARGDRQRFVGKKQEEIDWLKWYHPVVRDANTRAIESGRFSSRLLSPLLGICIELPDRGVVGASLSADIFLPSIAGLSTLNVVEYQAELPDSAVIAIPASFSGASKGVTLGRCPKDARYVDVKIRGIQGFGAERTEVWSVVVRKYIGVAERIDEVITPRTTGPIVAHDGDMLPTLLRDKGELWVHPHSQDGQAASTFGRLLRSHPGVSFGVRMSILRHGREVGTATGWWRFYGGTAYSQQSIGSVSPLRFKVPVNVLSEEDFRGDALGEWRVRIVGDPEVALQDISAEKWWYGQVELPLRVADMEK